MTLSVEDTPPYHEFAALLLIIAFLANVSSNSNAP